MSNQMRTWSLLVLRQFLHSAVSALHALAAAASAAFRSRANWRTSRYGTNTVSRKVRKLKCSRCRSITGLSEGLRTKAGTKKMCRCSPRSYRAPVNRGRPRVWGTMQILCQLVSRWPVRLYPGSEPPSHDIANIAGAPPKTRCGPGAVDCRRRSDLHRSTQLRSWATTVVR